MVGMSVSFSALIVLGAVIVLGIGVALFLKKK
jgi:hypothetical protein